MGEAAASGDLNEQIGSFTAYLIRIVYNAFVVSVR
jgi:DNA-directed RNA polymerase specialized sigma24 family protein